MGPTPTTPMDLYYKVPNDQQKPTSFSYNTNRCRFFLKIGTYLRIKVPALCCPPVSAFFSPSLPPPSLAPFLLTSLSLSLAGGWRARSQAGTGKGRGGWQAVCRGGGGCRRRARSRGRRRVGAEVAAGNGRRAGMEAATGGGLSRLRRSPSRQAE